MCKGTGSTRKNRVKVWSFAKHVLHLVWSDSDISTGINIALKLGILLQRGTLPSWPTVCPLSLPRSLMSSISVLYIFLTLDLIALLHCLSILKCVEGARCGSVLGARQPVMAVPGPPRRPKGAQKTLFLPFGRFGL